MKTFNYIMIVLTLVLTTIVFAQPVLEREEGKLTLNADETRRVQREAKEQTKARLLREANEYEQKARNTRTVANSISISTQ